VGIGLNALMPRGVLLMNLTEDEFDRLLEELANDIRKASDHFTLHCDLREAVENYERVFNETRAFWWLTINSNLDSCIFRLCRLYETEKNSLHLHNWLEFIKKNLHLFDSAKFKARLKTNPYVDSLADAGVQPDLKQLAKDLQATSLKDPLVKRLYLLRCNVYAHKNARATARGADWLKDYPFKYDEIEALIKRAFEILNRYSSLYKATSFSKQLIGKEDYQTVLDCVKDSLDRRMTRPTYRT
jgi:hypothetical protein